jgi:AMP nucleosidase
MPRNFSQDFERPTYSEPAFFDNAEAAIAHVEMLYAEGTSFLMERFKTVLKSTKADKRVRATYPYVAINLDHFPAVDSRLSYGFLGQPGRYQTTITRPDLFKTYLNEQLQLLLKNHQVEIEVGLSQTPIPIHFAFPIGAKQENGLSMEVNSWLRNVFDVPDLTSLDDETANAARAVDELHSVHPLGLFTAQRVDYSLQRLAHYTATLPEHFQNYVIFTNYQFYVDAFVEHSKKLIASGDTDYEAFIEPGNVITTHAYAPNSAPMRLPQMPAYHLKCANHSGITLINIGVGPSNAKTITDHVAVLRPQAWLMLGHCAGLRGSQQLGDYVLAHAYVREDHVLDADLPIWVPIPALAEVQVALEQAVTDVTSLAGYEVKTVMRTGTVVTIDNRNWELREQGELVKKFALSRAIALDMESATIAANGYRFRVPYGTLLCVSDKPLHGELKLPGMASAFYARQVAQHLEIGMKAMEKLRALPASQLHSRKLRSFSEVAFQ